PFPTRRSSDLEPRLEVVREALGLGPVDDPDRTLEPAPADLDRREEEPWRRGFVEEALPASVQSRPDALPLGGAAPVGGCGDRAVVGREAHEHRVKAVALPRELADVELGRLAELRRARVADVRVVGPDDDLWRPAR